MNRPTQDWHDVPLYDEASDERAEQDALRREDAEDAREMRETGTYNQRDYEMDVNL